MAPKERGEKALKAKASQQHTGRTKTKISLLIRRKKNESHMQFTHRRSEVKKKEQQEELLAPVVEDKEEQVEKKPNFPYQIITSTWGCPIEYLIHQELWPRVDEEPLPNGRKAIRQRDSREWNQKTLTYLAQVAKAAGEGRQNAREPLMHITRAIKKRQEESGIDERIDVGITAGDVVKGRILWEKSVRSAKERAKAMQVERDPPQDLESSEDEAKPKQKRPGLRKKVPNKADPGSGDG